MLKYIVVLTIFLSTFEAKKKQEDFYQVLGVKRNAN